MANSVGSCRGNGGLLRDRVKLPANFASNHTLIGFRWDCQQTGQLWLHCADVKILPGNGNPSPPAPTPSPTPTQAPSPGGQCDISEYNRQDCGYSGIQQQECEGNGCCWRTSNSNGVPWCYNGGGGVAPSPGAQCSVPDNQRQDCGFFGIDQGGCESRDCCWQESQSGAPWCYRGAQRASLAQSADKKNGRCTRDICMEVGLDAHGKARTQVCQKTSLPCDA